MNLRFLAVASLLLLVPVLNAQTKPYLNPALPIPQRVDDLVSRMTLDEKVSQTINTAPAIPRLGIPAYDWWSEGLHGIARSGYATMFPQAIGMAATWDAPLVHGIGEVTSIEARAKFNEAIRHDIHARYFGLTVWSPNINIFRDPRWGRGQETYGEDPFLTARLGVAFVRGLQGDDPKYFRTIATPKHFAVHSGPESTRHRANVDPSRHDLWDTYLPAFRATIVDAHADSIMCAYNRVDGAPACASKELLVDTLRHDWHFQGFVTSDCGAIDDFFESYGHHSHPDAVSASIAGLRAGTDTNCGNTYLVLADAVRKGQIPESELDVSVKRLFTARMRLGLFDPPAQVAYAGLPFSVVDSPVHRALALQAANESMVLLKNASGTLPLKPGLKTIAVIGPNAAAVAALDGNYNAIPREPILPLDAIAAEFPKARVVYAQGAPYAESVSLPAPRSLFHSGNEVGLRAEYFSGTSFTGSPVLTRTDREIDFDWNAAAPAPDVTPEAFAVRWSGTLNVPQPGSYTFMVRLAHCYPCVDQERVAVFLDGKEISTVNPTSPAGDSREDTTPSFTLNLPDIVPHRFRVEYRHNAPLFGAGITLEWTPDPTLLRAEAVAAARQADVVLAFVGLSRELEGEEMPIHIAGFAGGDRTDIQLPAAQQQMLEAVAATGKPLVVVLLNGSALAVNWANDHAAAILEAWYPGEEGGRAIAQTLSGKNNPAGRLPVTFYKFIDQLPPFDDYSMAHRTYRYFTGEPLFRFGDGLSYTTFQYANLKLSAPTLRAEAAALHADGLRQMDAADTLTLEADVQNTGALPGDEVAELYLSQPTSPLGPQRALSGFQRVHLDPGESRHLIFTLDSRTLSQVAADGTRAVLPGIYRLFLGGAQPRSSSRLLTFSITGTKTLPH